MNRPIAVLLVLAGLLLPAAASAAGPAATRVALERQMRQASGFSGAYAVDLESKQPLVEVRADARRVPASVEKLYTTSTALLRLGAGGRFTTRVTASAPLSPAGVLDGDLYLVGDGDPAFGSAEARRLAEQLTGDGGLQRVTGRVVGDESVFDSLRGPPSSGFETSGYVGPLSGLTFNRGRTAGAGFQSSPASYAAGAFELALRREGVRVTRDARRGEAPDAALALAEQPSPDVAELIRRTNVPSDNFIAETLLKDLGARFGQAGSTRAGAAVVSQTMRGLGLSPRISDGSGLSRANRTSPRQVVRLLEQMAAGPDFAVFERSLAVAGSTGTLSSRMRGTAAAGRCRAKTGTLSTVSALAGYCRSATGRRVAFAILMNGMSPFSARRLQDRMAVALARYEPAPAAPTSTGTG